MMVGRRSAFPIEMIPFWGDMLIFWEGENGMSWHVLTYLDPLQNQATSDRTKEDCAGAKVCEPVKSVPQFQKFKEVIFPEASILMFSDDWGTPQPPPKRKVFRFHYHS